MASRLKASMVGVGTDLNRATETALQGEPEFDALFSRAVAHLSHDQRRELSYMGDVGTPLAASAEALA